MRGFTEARRLVGAGLCAALAATALAQRPSAGPKRAASGVSLPEIRNAFRRTGMIVPLGDFGYSVSVQREAGESWSFILLGPDAGVDEPDAVIPVASAQQGLDLTLGERPYRVDFDRSAKDPEAWALRFRPTGGPRRSGHFVTLGAAKLAVFRASPGVAGLGPGWAVLYRDDTSASLEDGEIVLLEQTKAGVAFHPLALARFGDSGQAELRLGSKRVVLTLDASARLTARIERIGAR